MARTALVVLLTPVIVVAGVIAAVVMPAAMLGRHISVGVVARRRRALAPVLQLEASPMESSLGL